MDIHLIPLDYFELLVLAWFVIKGIYDGRHMKELSDICERLKDHVNTLERRSDAHEIRIDKLTDDK